MELTTRELASVILLAVFVGVALAIPKVRRDVLSSAGDVVKALLVPKILAVVAVYIGYTAATTFAAYRIGGWDVGLLKDTLIITFFVGFPIAMNAYKIRTGMALIRKVIRETVGISVLLAFYINIEALPLWGELLVQPTITFFTLMAFVGQREEKTKRVGAFFNVLTTLIVIGLLVHTSVQIIQNWRTYDPAQLVGSLALSIWLPVCLIPLIYSFAYVMHCESIFTRLPFFNDKKKPTIRARLALLVGLRFSTRLASSFNGLWLRQIARAAGFRDGIHVMRDFRQSLRDKAEAEQRRLAHLREFTGVDGVDENGLTLDRREFAETKSVLTHLFYMQMGWHRNQLGHFKDDMLNILGDLTRKGLPTDHGIELRVRKDKQAWMGWRRTPGGRYFGVGGTKNLNDQWQYDDPTPPKSFPAEGNNSWINATNTPSSPEWAAPDRGAAA